MNIFTRTLTQIASLTGLTLFCLCSQIHAQSASWNANSFKFTRDFAVADDMSGATAVTFSGSPTMSSPSISIPGFTFRFGVKDYSNLYISPFGFIKLGSPININLPENDSNVIVPLSNGTFWNAAYKVFGSAPNRKFVIEFTGTMQPSGEPTSFQLQMYEGSGKIQYVYEHLRGYFGFSSTWNYKIFCSTSILNYKNVAFVKTFPNLAAPTVSYSTYASNFDSIAANTRYSFEPDINKPAIPSQLSFSNIRSGCLTVNITEASNNESAIMLERADNGTNYKPEKIYYTTAPAGSTVYNYSQALLQPSWNYNYRVFVTNGFLYSDTLYGTVQTLAPQINGVKTVPGDYPTITSLLQSASCEHMGPNLVIELQNNYNFANETLPVAFNANLQTRLIQSITIRPAANANISWADSTLGALFYVDSVKHVFIDGRPGGIGTSQNLTIYQKHEQGPAIQYTNAADSGGINYCRIIKKNSTTYLSNAIVIVPYSYAFNYSKKDVDAFSITNNFISADAASVSDLIWIKPADTLKAKNYVISGNEFSRFTRSAIHFENGGDNLLIQNNKFYQPQAYTPTVYLPYTNASCINLYYMGNNVQVNDNYFGGNSSTWGIGKYIVNSQARDFTFINYQNSSDLKTAYISNNKIANVQFIGYGALNRLMYISRGNVTISNNRIGTADSLNSITTNEFFWGIDMLYSTKIAADNFFSGIQGGYGVGGVSNDSYIFTTSFNDSVAYYRNDIGGSNNTSAISSSGPVHAIYISGLERSMTLMGNNIHGISSRNRNVRAISGQNGLTGNYTDKFDADSNFIHHLLGAYEAAGIRVNLNTRTSNRVTNNEIYALKVTGNAGATFGTSGYVYGIVYNIYNYTYPTSQYIGEINISGNKIHSFESIRLIPGSDFNHYGILASCPVIKIYNNDIRFGLDSKGQDIDSLTTLTGIGVSGFTKTDQYFIEHNSIYFGGKGSTTSAIDMGNGTTPSNPQPSYILSNNILNINRTPLSGSVLSPAIYQKTPSGASGTSSAKNLWYSTSIESTATLLQTYKQSCHCDSSSFVGDPVFINANGDSTNYSLHLGPLSRADSTGTPSVLNIQLDRDYNNRNAYSPVDIGCYAGNPCGSGLFPTINITNPLTDSVQLCTAATFTIKTSITGGTFTSLQWQRNLIDSVGATADTLMINRAGDYRLIGRNACGQVASKVIHVTGNAVQASVSISTPDWTVCNGSAATFTAFPFNGGASPAYQWQINGINAGTNSSTFTTSLLTDNAQVKVIMSYASCAATLTTTSNVITITIVPGTQANAGPDTSICVGTSTILHGSGGSNFFWTPSSGLNNQNISSPVATPTVTTAYILTVSNIGSCMTRDTILITVSNAFTPTAIISTLDTTICSGSTAIFTATSTNGGSAPTYQWKVNGTNVGTNSNSFNSSTLNNNDQVTVDMTSSISCVTTPIVTSNVIRMTVEHLVVPTISVADHLFTVTNPDVTVTYTWQKLTSAVWGNVVPMATGTSYTAPTGDGEYRVKAVKGTCTQYSVSQQTSLQSPTSHFVYLRPNPTTNFLRIDSIRLDKHYETVEIVDLAGSRMMPLVNAKNQISVTIDVSGLRPGSYLAIIRQRDGVGSVLKFEKL